MTNLLYFGRDFKDFSWIRKFQKGAQGENGILERKKKVLRENKLTIKTETNFLVYFSNWEWKQEENDGENPRKPEKYFSEKKSELMKNIKINMSHRVKKQ